MKRTKSCEQCGTTFETPTSAPHKRFCSSACREDWWTERRRLGEEALKATTVPAKEGAKS